VGIGRLPGEVLDDEEGIRTFSNLGKNLVHVLNKMKS